MCDFLAILKNNKKYIKFDSQLDFYMKNILIGWIDYLNFEDEKIIRSTQTICITRSTVA
jgi:hypothetical protein